MKDFEVVLLTILNKIFELAQQLVLKRMHKNLNPRMIEWKKI